MHDLGGTLGDTYDIWADPNINPDWYDNVPPFSSGGGTYNDGVRSSGGINWNNVLDLGFGLGSQIVQAQGRNPTQQIGGAGVVGIGGGYNPSSVLQAGAAYNRGAGQVPIYAAAGAGVHGGGVAEDTVGSLSRIVAQHPLMIFGGIAALFLLYRQPPGRR
jgi:hypothetical protein